MLVMKKIVILLSFLFFTPFFSIGLIKAQAVSESGTNNAGHSFATVFEGHEHIRSFKSDIIVNKNGTINVKEEIIYDFGLLSKHGIYRVIPYIKTNDQGKNFQMDIKVLGVTDENEVPYQYTNTDNGNSISLKIGNPDKTITGSHTYIISYRVSGALSYFSDHDELYWNATGNDWNIPLAHAEVSVQLPPDVMESKITTTCFTGIKGSSEKNCSSNILGYKTIFSANKPLLASEGLTIIVGFPKKLVAVLEPKEVVPFWQTILGKLVSLGIALLALFWYIIYPIKIILKWMLHGRDPKGTIGEVAAWFDPPKTHKGERCMTPGEVGTLGDETVDMKDISATIVDLARRGYFRIEERKKGDFYFVKTAEFENDARLLVYEQKLLKGMFGAKKTIHIKDEDLYRTVEEAKKNLYQLTVDDGLFAENPQSIRTFYSVIAGIALFTGNFFLAIVAFIFGRNMPHKTVDGVNAFHVGKSLKNFLSSQERQLEFQAKNQMMFEKLLPYAIAFGVEKIWAKRFADISISPTWYQGYGITQMNAILLTGSLNSSLRSFSSAATPTRSSSGFSSGFSGGGGGGGGGGSW